MSTLRPADVCRQLLAPLDASEGRRQRVLESYRPKWHLREEWKPLDAKHGLIECPLMGDAVPGLLLDNSLR